MGTPEIAARCLSALLDAGHQVVAAICQPDKPKGRGYALTPPPVKVLAEERGVPVYQPLSLRGEEFSTLLTVLDPELIAVVAYGKILPHNVLVFPRYGCVNVHASLLPRLRGAAPIQRAIMEGEGETGVTTMRMDDGVDTGDMLLREVIPLTDRTDFGTLYEEMSRVGAELLCRTVAELAAGTLTPTPQDHTRATLAPKIEKEDCRIDFTRTAAEIDRQVRGLSPAPLAFTHLPDGKTLKIVSAVPAEGTGAPGEVLRVADKKQGEIVVACGQGALCITAALPEGKGRMSAADLVRGRRVRAGDRLGG